MSIDLDSLAPFAVGSAGAVVSLKFVPGPTWAERAFNVLTGCLCAGFLAPAAAEWFHMTSRGLQFGLAFLVGMFGLSVAAAVASGLRDLKLAEMVAGWLPGRKG